MNAILSHRDQLNEGMLETQMQHQPDQLGLYKITFPLSAGKFWSLCIYFCTFSLESYFGHMGETLLWSTWLCSAHAPLQAASLPLSVTNASIHLGEVSKYRILIWSLILFWKWAIQSRNTLAALPLGVQEFCLLADSTNDPELPALILVGYSLKFWCCRLRDTMWATVCYRCPSHMHIYEVQQQSFPKYPEVLSDVAAGLCKSFRSPLFDLWKHTNAQHGGTNVYPNKLKQFPTRPWLLLTWCRGRAGSTRTRSSQCHSRNKEDILGLMDFFSAAWNGCESKQKETVGSTKPVIPSELAGFAGVVAGLCPHPHVMDWHHGVFKKNILIF